MIIDYHLHTKGSPDGKGSMEEYAEAAKRKNIDEIGFSDHILLEHLDNRHNFLVREMPVYVETFRRFKESASIPAKLGVEVDYFQGRIGKIRDFIAKYPFDYVIGSVHVIGGWIIDDPSEVDEYSKREPLQVYAEYFRLVREMCSSRLFDVVGHPDLVKIFGAKPSVDITQMYEETAEAIADANMCAEINPKGLIRPCREIYPSEQFLKILHRYDIPITFGSDAHEPKDVGQNLQESVKMAKKVGYDEACTFNQKEKTFAKI